MPIGISLPSKSHGQIRKKPDPTSSGSDDNPQLEDSDGATREDIHADPMLKIFEAHALPEVDYLSLLINESPPIHPKTRHELLGVFDSWVTRTPKQMGRSSIIWFFQDAGNGKTAVQLHLAQTWQKDARLIASIFLSPRSFLNIKPEDVVHQFVATLAYQVARKVPGLWPFVSSALRSSPEIFSKSPEDQMTSLVFVPLKELVRGHPTNPDLLAYLYDEFARIRGKHQGIPDSWPTAEVYKQLITKACGLFIYVSIVIRFVDDPRADPVSLLEQVLSTSPETDNTQRWEQSYAELDALYTAILHPPDVDGDSIRRLLWTIMFCDKSFRTASELEEHLSIDPGSAETMWDYLITKERSGDMYQSFHVSHAST
ncbi:hypothetical protein H1R20_g302, partial [Candolleomyces eurysporus]